MLTQKIIQEKLIKFKKILNYIKSSYIIFCAEMFGYSHFLYCLQEESIHFGLRVLKILVWRYKNILSPKNHTRKIDKIPNVFCIIGSLHMTQSVSTPSNRILLTYDKNIFTISHQFLLSTNFINKNQFYSFFLIFWHTPIPSSCWMPYYRH